MTDDNLHSIFTEIERLASEPDVDASRIRQLANSGLMLLGFPDDLDVQAAKATKVQKLIAEGTDASEAVRLAGLMPGE